MLCLYVQAPFAVFRTFAAGWYRPTAAFLTPSAAYGLALNLAGIETRRDDGLSAMTVTQFDLPAARVALGADPLNPHGPHPSTHTIYQQLHNYPVGESGKSRREEARGNKYNITPVRREFLADLRALVCLDFGDRPDIEAAIRRAVAGEPDAAAGRYGLPFLGDNAFLIDKIRILDAPEPAHWYRRLGPDDEAGFLPLTTRLTIWIDRQDMSKTRSALFAPLESPSVEIPPAAWTAIEPPPTPKPPEKPPKKKG